MKSVKKIENHNSRNEYGFMASEWIAAVAVLMIPMFLVVVSLIQLPQRKTIAQDAASEAARAYVQADNLSQADTNARAAAVAAVYAGLGLDEDAPIPNGYDINIAIPRYCPGETVVVEVQLAIPVTYNPFSKSNDLFEVGSLSSKATQRIDDYSQFTYNEADC